MKRCRQMAIRKLQRFPFFAVHSHTATVTPAIRSRSRHIIRLLTGKFEHVFWSVQGTFKMRKNIRGLVVGRLETTAMMLVASRLVRITSGALVGKTGLPTRVQLVVARFVELRIS